MGRAHAWQIALLATNALFMCVKDLRTNTLFMCVNTAPHTHSITWGVIQFGEFVFTDTAPVILHV